MSHLGDVIAVVTAGVSDGHGPFCLRRVAFETRWKGSSFQPGHFHSFSQSVALSKMTAALPFRPLPRKTVRSYIAHGRSAAAAFRGA